MATADISTDHERMGWHRWGHIFHRVPETAKIDIAISRESVAKQVRTLTNYADNGADRPMQSADNVLVADADDAMYDNLLRRAMTDCTMKTGKLMKWQPQTEQEGDLIEFTYIALPNYDTNIVYSLADTMEQYIVYHIVTNWLLTRNEQLYKRYAEQFANIGNTLTNLVNWKKRMPRRPIDPIF